MAKTPKTCHGCGTTLTRKNDIYFTEKTTTDLPTCQSCWDRSGDENAVSDGHMTCAEFQAKWGEHSEYCDGTDATVELTLEEVYDREHCQCGCGGSPKGKKSRWLPGHDARNGGFKARNDSRLTPEALAVKAKQDAARAAYVATLDNEAIQGGMAARNAVQ